jgi:deoxyribodipyrimidine photo-lyase
MNPPAPVLVWFRRDLRLADQPALAAAVATGRPVLPVYVLASGGRVPGGASRWWLHHSLAALAAALARRGSPLLLRAGAPGAVLARLVAETGATEVACTAGLDPDAAAEEAAVAAALPASIRLARHAPDALHVPGSVVGAAGTPLRVFTPFWRACTARPEPAEPRPAPLRWPAYSGAPAGEALADWQLLPAAPDWAAGLREAWRPGEAAAQRALEEFLDSALADYAAERNRPDRRGTSRLSPHLHFGEISPRQVWHAVRSRAAGDSRLAHGAEAFLRELGWREFSLHLLHHWPDLPRAPFQPAFARFPWRRDAAGLRAWQRGLTGYPLVDAGMRELWATGWMHNRVRMVAASFLVKHLLVHWREGEAWFWDTLVDADAANNAASWQWVAGCGADAAPYFRIFNPALQGAKFDPGGAYVTSWVPELARLPPRYLHAPWTAPAAVLRAAGIELGRDYPHPVVEHAAARARALGAYAALRA